jgi:FkbH-like protein
MPLLSRALAEFGLDASVRAGPYGQLLQVLHAPSSLLHEPADALSFLLIRAQDLLGDGDVPARARELALAIAGFRERSRQPLVALFTEPLDEPGRQFISAATEQLDPIADTFVITPEQVRQRYRCGVIHDAAADSLGHIPYTRTYFAALALSITRFCWRFRQPERKVLVLDCDNTLWQGVCGEAGPHGVVVDEAAQALQQCAVRLSETGTVICLASKNVEEDVHAVFDLNADMVLRREQIIDTRINWEPKSANLNALAEALDLSVDSFVFVDDNPVEIAEVAAVHPGVLGINWPAGADHAADVPHHFWALDRLKENAADRLRVQSYRDNVARAELRAQTPSFTRFIQSLELVIDLSPLVPTDVGRVAQLFVRTTQFNAGNGHLSESELLTLASAPDSRVFTAKVRDRFGDYGLVGVGVLEQRATELCVRELLMSCRVLGKGVEHALLREIGRVAMESDLNCVRVNFKPTARNLPMLRFLTAQAHKRDGDDFVFTSDTFVRAQLPDDESAALAPLQEQDQDQDQGLAGVEPVGQGLSSKTAAEVHQRAIELADPADLERLLDADRNLRPRDLAWVAPKAGLEVTLAAIWSQVLRVDDIGRTDPFKALGGSSLDMVRVHRLIHERLAKELALADLLSASTIADIAALIDKPSATTNAMDAARQRADMQRQFARKARPSFVQKDGNR